MTGESTNSKETENTEDVDSTTDSDEAESKSDAGSQDTDDSPVVIEGEAEEVETEETSAVDEEDATASEETLESEETPEVVSADETEVLPPVAPPVAEEKRASAWPLIIGGLIAGGLGFLAANLASCKTPRPTRQPSRPGWMVWRQKLRSWNLPTRRLF